MTTTMTISLTTARMVDTTEGRTAPAVRSLPNTCSACGSSTGSGSTVGAGAWNVPCSSAIRHRLGSTRCREAKPPQSLRRQHRIQTLPTITIKAESPPGSPRWRRECRIGPGRPHEPQVLRSDRDRERGGAGLHAGGEPGLGERLPVDAHRAGVGAASHGLTRMPSTRLTTRRPPTDCRQRQCPRPGATPDRRDGRRGGGHRPRGSAPSTWTRRRPRGRHTGPEGR